MKRVLDLLGIILPAILLLFVIIRPFLQRNKPGKPKKGFLNFLNGFIIVLLILVGVLRYLFFSNGGSNGSGPKPEPIQVSAHSVVFNESLEKVLDAYYSMTDAFAGGDTTSINRSAKQLKMMLDNFKVDELKKDSIIYLTTLDPLANAKVETESIMKDPAIDEKRGSLNVLSDNLRSLLVTVKYDLAKVYWQECSEAFGEDKPGNWLSRTVNVKNPYPLKDGKDCGAPKDTLNYMPVDTTKTQ